jgi:ElaB/YqjD/DUF883 family membrane-anchored ribosome-binding protein
MDDNRISDQASNAADNLKSGMATAAETASDLAGKARSAAADASNRVQDAAVETSKQAADLASKTYKQGMAASDYVSRNTAEQPLVALLIAAAVGYGLAYIIHGR